MRLHAELLISTVISCGLGYLFEGGSRDGLEKSWLRELHRRQDLAVSLPRFTDPTRRKIRHPRGCYKAMKYHAGCAYSCSFLLCFVSSFSLFGIYDLGQLDLKYMVSKEIPRSS